MQPEVFHIGDTESLFFKNLHHLFQAWGITSREKPFVGPGTGWFRPVLADTMDQSPAVFIQHMIDNQAQLFVMVTTHVFQHPDRDEYVKIPSFDVSVIVQDVFNPILEAFLSGPGFCEFNLLG